MSRYGIFVSSTIDDLEEARAAVDQELEAAEIFAPIRVEHLPASDETSRRVCLREVGEADAIVLILKDRYGFVPQSNNPEKLSVTHLEYREAKRLNKPVFAFLCDGVQPEPELASFIREVSNFDEGVLRKKWTTTQELRAAVRRALLFWLARRARQGKSKETKQVAIQLDRDPTLGRLPLMSTLGSTQGDAERVWRDTLLDQLSRDCKLRLLPTPELKDRAFQDGNVTGLNLRILPAIQAGRLELTIGVTGQHHELTIPAPVELDAALTDEGARFAAQCALALVLLFADDWSAAVDQLLTVSRLRSASNRSQIQLLAAAAFVSAWNQGQRSAEIVECMLGLPKLDSHAVSAGVMALAAAELHLEHAGARRALGANEKLTVQLLISALSQDPRATENIYNLARRSLGNESAVALSFYSELLRVDPSYEERWYFHRDLGLIYYGHRDFERAGDHYDRSCYLKANDSEVFRLAGDTYYYRGYWADALLRYERALAIEPIETYFLDAKIAFCRAQLRKGRDRYKAFQRRRDLSHRLSRLGSRAAEAGWQRLAEPVFRLAISICVLNFDAENWLALYANRRGAYGDAIVHLKCALAVIPEDPSTRLNLVMNLIFQNAGQFVDCARKYASSAIFHGGPETQNRFRLRLTNTGNKDDLCEQFRELLEVIRLERDEWVKRRREVLKPELFNGILHVEFRS